ncbi:MAG: NUDIX hydrolase [Gammaproteobacteria bacterium]|nr:NUDIX hydrolase [Gammaproteobacteria bacterium]
MNYCSVCGEQVRVGVPDGDNRPRHICDHCGTVHYHNPKVVAGCIAHWEDQVLMCRRAIEPRYGKWTVPAGFMENGETTYEGAIRETLEEANARVAIDDLYVTVNLPHINQVYMLFRGRLLDLDFSPGDESLETELMSEERIPWAEVAFPTVGEALKLYFADRRIGAFGVHMLDIVRRQMAGGYQVRQIS